MPRGSKPGERRGGRKPGSRNKATAEIQDLARQYTDTALHTLGEICEGGESETARVSAACALLDRGYGKPKQAIEGNITGTLKIDAPWLSKRGV